MYYSLYEWYNPLWKSNTNKFAIEHTWPQIHFEDHPQEERYPVIAIARISLMIRQLMKPAPMKQFIDIEPFLSSALADD
ncbi:MAG TPA: hypothetical protein VGP55_15590 [Chitinophagaceae bacterium]|nr:hypothetical protein [Chitinophagaceae bacterium]